MAALPGHVDIVKYLVENGAEVNVVDMVRIDKFNITYRLRVVILLCSFQNSVSNDNKTGDYISILCLCWFLHGRFDNHVIKRVNYVVEQGERVDVRNDVTIIMYRGWPRESCHAFKCSLMINKLLAFEKYLNTHETVFFRFSSVINFPVITFILKNPGLKVITKNNNRVRDYYGKINDLRNAKQYGLMSI